MKYEEIMTVTEQISINVILYINSDNATTIIINLLFRKK